MNIKVENGYDILISKGQGVKFNSRGERCDTQTPQVVARVMPTSLPCECISIITTGIDYEVAFFDTNDIMHKYSCSLKSASAVSLLLMKTGTYFRLYKYSATECGITYTQLIFVYRDKCLIDYVNLLGLKEK